MKAFQEITEWNSDFAVPNHVYFLSDSKDKMYGYVRSEDGVVQVFAKPYRFHTRGRKFTEIKNTWKVKVDDAEPVEGRNWTVAGSKGAVYTVTENRGSWTCTCPAAKWQKGECKHIKSLQDQKI
jgi:hypothetical protein